MMQPFVPTKFVTDTMKIIWYLLIWKSLISRFYRKIGIVC